MERPIVICGLGRMGARVLNYLIAAGMPVVIVDTVCKPDDPRLRGAKLVVGDSRRREVLEAAGVAEARGVLILTNDDQLNVTTALMVRGLNREVRIVLRMFNQNLLARLGKSVHNVFALSTSLLTAPILATTALMGQSLRAYRIDDSPRGLRQLVEITIGPTSVLRDQTVARIMTQRDVGIVAHLPRSGDTRLLLDVKADSTLRLGDRVILHGSPEELAPILFPEDLVSQQLRWANGFYRLGRVAVRTIKELDLAVTLCTAVVILIVLVSTIILKHGIPEYKWHTAFLRTVSIMATVGALHEEEFREFEGITVFASTLRIVGAVLMAAFTAIVTQYLLRAKLGGAFEARRIPESGHVIVCGLSNVGFRVVEELTRLKESVVVIERDATSRFVTTARRMGAAVMIGDACIVEVLRQANAAQARSVIPATNSDMTNLEVTLLVHELNPKVRVVPLLNDPQFAEMLRDAAGVHHAVSAPVLAAPAFLAGIFGDRVQGVFFIDNRLYAVVELMIDKHEPLDEAAIRAVAVDYHLLPVVLVRGDGATAPRPLMGGRLEAGDRLFVVTALSDLENLLRRQTSLERFALDVLSCPLPTREKLLVLVQTTCSLPPEEVEAVVKTMPFRLPRSLTRGQAEDLKALLEREKITCVVRPDSEPLPQSEPDDQGVPTPC